MDVTPLALAAARSYLYYGAIYGITVAVAAWIFRDVRRRGGGTRRAAAWAIATLVFTILAVLAYLFVRSRAEDPDGVVAEA